MEAKRIAKGLAWLGIGIGAVECLAPGAVSRFAGLERHSGLIRLFGMREIASGVLIIAARDPVGWLWTRVLGDAFDGALLSAGLRASNPNSARTLAATAVVAPVVVMDVIYTFGRRR